MNKLRFLKSKVLCKKAKKPVAHGALVALIAASMAVSSSVSAADVFANDVVNHEHEHTVSAKSLAELSSLPYGLRVTASSASNRAFSDSYARAPSLLELEVGGDLDTSGTKPSDIADAVYRVNSVLKLRDETGTVKFTASKHKSNTSSEDDCATCGEATSAGIEDEITNGNKSCVVPGFYPDGTGLELKTASEDMSFRSKEAVITQDENGMMIAEIPFSVITHGQEYGLPSTNSVSAAGTVITDVKDVNLTEFRHFFAGSISLAFYCDGHIIRCQLKVDEDAFHVNGMNELAPVCGATHELSGYVDFGGVHEEYANVHIAERGVRPSPYQYFDLSESPGFEYVDKVLVDGLSYNVMATQTDTQGLSTIWVSLVTTSVTCGFNPTIGMNNPATYEDDFPFQIHIRDPETAEDSGDGKTHVLHCVCQSPDGDTNQNHYDKAWNSASPSGLDTTRYYRDHICDVCDATTTQHTFITNPNQSYISTDANKHWRVCMYCGELSDEGEHQFEYYSKTQHKCKVCNRAGTHTDTNQDHYCDTCNYEMSSHNWSWSDLDFASPATPGYHQQSCSFTGCNATQNFAEHRYTGTGSSLHKCADCGHTTEHTYQMVVGNTASPTYNGHYEQCTICSAQRNKAAHSDTSPKDHICDVCKYKMSEHTYSWTKTATTHKESCTYCGDVRVAEAPHYDNNKDHNCDLAGCAYQNLTAHDWGPYTYEDASGHVRTCTFTGCRLKDTKQAHRDAEPAHNHLCDVCNGKVSEHTYTRYSYEAVIKNGTSIQHGKKCDLYTSGSNTNGCDNIGMLENHVDNNQDHYCDTCNYKMTEHNWATSFTPIMVGGASTQHGKECTFTGCNEVGSKANHQDKVKPAHYCDDCNYKMSEHDYSDIQWIYSNAEKTESEVHNTFCVNPICDSALGEEAHYDVDLDTYCDYCNWGPMYRVEFVGPVAIPATIPNGADYQVTWTHGSECPGRYYEIQYKIDNGSWQSLSSKETGEQVTKNLSASRTAKTLTVRLRMRSTTGMDSVWVESNVANILQPLIPEYTRTPATVYTDSDGHEWIGESAMVRLKNVNDAALNSFVEYSLDGGTTWERYNAPFDVESSVVDIQYRSKVTDTIVSDIGHASIYIDTTPPGAPTATKSNNNEWANEDVIVTLSDTGDPGPWASGVKKIQYMPTGSSVWEDYTDPIVVDKVAVITSRVIDNVGNVSQITITNVNVTKNAPSLDLEQEVTKITRENYDIVATGKPTNEVDGSPVAYIVDPDGVRHDNTTGTNRMTINWEVEANGVYEFQVFDEAGNKGTKTITITNFDRVKPNPVKVVLDPADGWSSGQFGISFEDGGDEGDPLTKGAAVKKIQYYFTATEDGTGAWIDMEKTTDPYPSTKRDDFGFVKVRAVDLAGNEGDITTVKIKIDKHNPAKPTLTPNVPATGDDGWTKVDVTVTITDNGDNDPSPDVNSGVARIEIRKNGGNWEPVTGKVIIDSTTELEARVIDNVGNISPVETGKWQVDKVPPQATVKKEQVGDKMKITITATDDNSGVNQIIFNGQPKPGPEAVFEVGVNAVYPLKVTDKAGNEHIVDVTVDELDLTAPNPPEIVPNPDVDWSQDPVEVTLRPTGDPDKTDHILWSTDGENWEKYENPFDVEETTTIYAKAVDKFGHESVVVTKLIQIDNTKPGDPVITTDPEPDDEDTPVQGPVDVEITDTGDDGSGVQKIIYTTSWYKDLTGKDLVWKEYDGKFEITRSTHIVAKVIDNAGNESNEIHKIVLIDNTPPHVTTSIEPDTLTNKRVNINHTHIPFTPDDEIADPNLLPTNHNQELILRDENGQEVISSTDTNGTLHWTASDGLGNSVELTIVINNIDKMKPNVPVITRGVDVDYVTDKNTITIADQGDLWDEGCVGAGVDHIEYSVDDGANWLEYTGPFDVTATTTVIAKVVDKAGNESDSSTKFVGIGDERPAITIIEGPSKVWIKGQDKVKFKVTGVTLGVKNVRIVEDASMVPTLIDDTTPGTKVYEVVVKSNGEYTIEAVDVLDQSDTEKFTEDRLDNTNPTAEKVEQTDPNTWTKSKIITLNVKDFGPGPRGKDVDQSRVVKVEVYFETGSTPIGEMVAKTPTVDVDGKTTADAWTYTVTKNGHYYFKVIDGVGNFLDKDALKNNNITVDHIDTEPPTVDGEVDPPGWTNKDPELVIEADDDSGIIVDIVVKKPDGTVVWEKHFDPDKPGEQPDWPIRVPVDENGDYTVEVTDPTGEKGTGVIKVGNIDKIPPVIDIQNVPTGNVPAFAPDVVVTDEGSGLDKIVIKDSTGNIIKEVDLDGESEFTIDDWIVSVNDKYTIVATDRAGNTSEKELVVTNIQSDIEPYLGEAWWNRSPDELQGKGLKDKVAEVLAKDMDSNTKWYYTLEKVK